MFLKEFLKKVFESVKNPFWKCFFGFLRFLFAGFPRREIRDPELRRLRMTIKTTFEFASFIKQLRGKNVKSHLIISNFLRTCAVPGAFFEISLSGAEKSKNFLA